MLTYFYGAYKMLLAVDPSLTCSGWALFSPKNEQLLAVGKVRALPPKHALASRLSDLQKQIYELLKELKLSSNDVLVCEAATTIRDPRAAFIVEQVRTIFESVARSFRLTVPGRVNPRTVQYEIMGLRGKQVDRKTVKQTAIEVVGALYSVELKKLGLLNEKSSDLKKHQDIVDAMLIGRLVLSRLKDASLAGTSLEEMLSENERAGMRSRRRWKYGNS